MDGRVPPCAAVGHREPLFVGSPAKYVQWILGVSAQLRPQKRSASVAPDPRPYCGLILPARLISSTMPGLVHTEPVLDYCVEPNG